MCIRRRMGCVVMIIGLALMTGCRAAEPTATLGPPTDTVMPRATPTSAPPTATQTQVLAVVPTPSEPTATPETPLEGHGGGLIAFYSERDGNAEIYTINADGSAETRLTDNHALDIVPDLSPDGSQIVFVSDRDGNDEIYRMNWDGSGVVRLTHTPAQESYPYWSADGTKIVFCSKRDDGRTFEVYLMNGDGTDQKRITTNSVSEEWAYLSPDMQKIVYAVGPLPRYSLYVMNVDGSDPHQIFSSDKSAALPKWSRDGRTIACNHATLTAGRIVGDVCLMNGDGSDLRQITQSAANAVSENPYWSPDGSRIVFQSNRTGNFQIYVMNADGSEQVRLTHHRGNDYWPSWGPAPAKPAGDSAKPGADGLYLGQEPPGLDVEVFAPGVVSLEEGKEYNITISPDLQEIFFTRRTPGGRDDRIWTSRIENGRLTLPEPAPFTYDGLETDACFTPDGNRLYFNSARPLPGEKTTSRLPNVWFVDRTETGWSEPQFVGPPLNDYHPVYFSIANDGTLYFTRSSPRGIYYAEPEDGQYLEAHRLPDEINYVRDVAHPAVAPDESYIIVNSSYEQNGRLVGSLYISFKRPDGSWTKAVSMHDALKASEADVYAIPRITPDGKYLFFERYEADTDRSDIYWVSTAVVEQLKPY